MDDLGKMLMAYWVLPGAIAGGLVALLRGKGIVRALVDLLIGGVGGFLGAMAYGRLAPIVFAKPSDVTLQVGLAVSAIGGLIFIWLVRRLISAGGG